MYVCDYIYFAFCLNQETWLFNFMWTIILITVELNGNGIQ